MLTRNMIWLQEYVSVIGFFSLYTMEKSIYTVFSSLTRPAFCYVGKQIHRTVGIVV